MITNVLEFLEASCARYPDKIAVADDKQQLTYKELSDLSDKIGAVLIPYVEQNSPVPVFMDKSCMALAVFLGVVKAGCFYCMMDTSQPADRLNHILATLEARVMIINEKSAKKQAKLDFTGMVIPVESHIDDVIDEGDRLAMAKRREQAIDIDPLYAIFTSGSTGVPRALWLITVLQLISLRISQRFLVSRRMISLEIRLHSILMSLLRISTLPFIRVQHCR